MRAGGSRGRNLVALLNELGNRSVSLCQRFFIRQKYDAEVLRAGFLSEAGAVHHHHMFLANEFLDEDFVALGDIAFWKTYAREGVESAARRNATHARGRFAPLLRKIAT